MIPVGLDRPLVCVFTNNKKISASAVANYLRIHWQAVSQLALSPVNVKIMNEWIRDCRHTHTACRTSTSRSSQNMPTRIIFVGNHRLGTLPRLVLVSELPYNFRYATLSYCWGPPSSMRLTTTTETLSTRLNSLSWNELPRVFNDSFVVAQELGLEFIWIDALCILQDDARDWEVEAAKMGAIYQNAHVTIVAANSQSTDHSFLRREESMEQVEIPFTSKKHAQVSGQYKVSFSPSGYTTEFVEDVERSQWNERGWTFQERLLSRRVIFFGKRIINFECRTYRQAENYRGTLNRNLAFLKHLQSLDDWRLIQMSWRNLVEEYSGRVFTYNKDRLPALAGLAQELLNSWDHDGEPIQYLAGHFQEGLETDLIWMSGAQSLDTAESVTTTVYVAPSWSWCSSPGKVLWPKIDASEELRTLCRITSTRTKLVSSNQLGAVTSGSLDILGLLSHYKFDHTFLTEGHFDQTWYTTSHYGFGWLDVNFAFDVHVPKQDLLGYLQQRVWLALICYTTETLYGLVLVEENNCKPLKGGTDDEDYTLLRTPLRRLGLFKSGPKVSVVTDLLFAMKYSSPVQNYGFRIV